MRKTRILAIVAIASFAVAALVTNASAGNYLNTSVKHYSLQLLPGQYISSSNGDTIILVDDVTYSVMYEPCNPYPVCEFFNVDHIPDKFMVNDPWFPFPDPITTEDGMGGLYFLDQYFEQVVSLATQYGLALTDTDDDTNTDFIDRFNMGSYGQMIFRDWREGFHLYAWHVTDTFAGAGYGAGGFSRPMAAEPTFSTSISSASRHFQSPHVVQHGRVALTQTVGPSLTAWANVKGRTTTTSDPNAPVIDTTLSVATSGP